jgi:RNA polymerase sigma factor (sigma-70 family)
MVEPTDIALLQDYALRNSEEAFTTLVQRHVRLVYSVALRQLGNAHQAEEVTQAVFIILARKAAGFRSGTMLTGWLYQTARLTTANFLRSERRRHRREQEAHMQSEIRESHAEPVWQGLAPLLDEAMGHLGAKERNAILLRYFEGRTFSEVAVALDSNETAVQKRINRAVGKLQTFFARRGVKVAAGVLVGVVTANSLQAAPAGLAASVATAATVKGAAASGSTLALIKGTLKLMAWAKVKTTIVVGACVLAAGTTTVTLYSLERPVWGIPANWSVIDGDPAAWHWENGKINVHSTTSETILASSKKYGDVTLSVLASTTNREASLAIRMQDADNGYLIIFAPAGTPIPWNPSGYIRLIKKTAGNEVTLAAYHGRMFSSLGQSAKIVVTARGSLLEVRLNNVRVLQVVDTTYATGRIGLRIFGDPDNPCDASFASVTFH